MRESRGTSAGLDHVLAYSDLTNARNMLVVGELLVEAEERRLFAPLELGSGDDLEHSWEVQKPSTRSVDHQDGSGNGCCRIDADSVDRVVGEAKSLAETGHSAKMRALQYFVVQNFVDLTVVLRSFGESGLTLVEKHVEVVR